jgi:SAM-dependent methyltransferase
VTVDPQTGQVWASADAYERYVGRWSRLVAHEFVGWLAAPRGWRWLDVGCGTGALSHTIAAIAAPSTVVGVDPSEGFVELARSESPAVCEFLVGDALSLPFRDGEFDAAVAGLVLNFVPEPARAVAEMRRVVGDDGVVAAYLWDYGGKMELMRYFWDVAAELDSRAAELDEGRRFHGIDRPDALESLWRDAGLADVETRAIDVPTHFRDFDDYWAPFLGGQGPGPAYAMSLDEHSRERLRGRLAETLPREPDGSIALVARGWAVRGVADAV